MQKQLSFRCASSTTNKQNWQCLLSCVPVGLRGEVEAHPTETPRRINLITDCEYCVHLFGDNSITPRFNKQLIHCVRQLLNQVWLPQQLSISWISWHTEASTRPARLLLLYHAWVAGVATVRHDVDSL